MLTVIEDTKDIRWDSIAGSFRQCDIYYLSAYLKAFQIHGDGSPVLFFYEDKNIRAMNAVMKRDIERDARFKGDIPPDTLYDLSTPYGYGGFLIEGNITADSLSALDEEYSSYCRENGIVSEFVRFHPVLCNAWAVMEIYDSAVLGNTITVDLSSREQIWNNLTSKNRNMIRKAQKSGVRIFWGLNPELMDEFIPLYQKTMDKDSADAYYYFNKDFYESFFLEMKYHSLLFYAVYDGKIIAMSILLFLNQQLHYHLSASDADYRQLAPTNLLLYEAACWGCENGFHTFHLGGGVGSREDGLYAFKKSFNRNSGSVFTIGRKIFDEEQYHKLAEIRMKEDGFKENTAFFPVYRG